MGNTGSTVNSTSLNIEKICEKIKNNEIKRIIVMCGAGISTSAGIPDFRSPSTGLYVSLIHSEYHRSNPNPKLRVIVSICSLN